MSNGNVKIPVIVIFAPTASGKTALTKELFSEAGSHFVLNGEIVSADSQAVYKYMDIGTAKPEPDFCKIIPHHLINEVTPDMQFTVADFIEKADNCCKEIFSRNHIPIVCGGTGFYIRHFLFGLPQTPESNSEIRNKLQKRIETEGNEALYAELKIVDPESADKIHINDSYRICRSLEIFYTTGKKRSDYKLENKYREDFDFKFFVLEPPKDLLYSRIKTRVEKMMDSGLREEINNLKIMGYNESCPGLKAIGYSEWFKYDSEEEIKNAIISNSWKYAKKQYTYIRDIPNSIVIPFSSTDEDIINVGKEIKKLF